MSARPPTSNDSPWTGDYVSSNGATADARHGSPGRLVVLGYITAVAMPLLGLLVGIVVLTRPARATSRHGRWIIGISIVASVIWVLVFVSGVFTTPSNDMGY